MFHLILVFLLAASVPIQGDLTVKTSQGEIRGKNATDGNYYTFYGIHYGGSTAGANRFKPPTPPPTYPGVYEAIDYNVICAQPSERGLIGTEDCLTLNVFTKNNTSAKPVLVWIIGEEYTNSPTSKSFKNLVEEDIVVVQINYRLSIFGFLCLGIPEAPGNVGLKDIVQGLKWIQANIAGFGGDANNVILFGHASGAAIVDLLTMSPMARNLFHKAVTQSGSVLSPWAISYTPIQSAHALGAQLGYAKKSNQELLKRLAETDLSVLATEINKFESQLLNNTALFAPCIENPALSPNETFLADAPINLLRSGNYSHVPYIAGYTDREGTIRAEEAAYRGWLEKMQNNFTDFIPVDLDLGTNKTNITSTIRQFYFGMRAVNMETIEDYLDYQGDSMILVSVIRGAKERASTSKADVRLLEFNYMGTQNSDWGFTTIPVTGARHGAVLHYLLDYDLRPQLDEPAMTALTKRYVGFFKTGIPIQPTNPGPLWQPITNQTINYLLLSGGDQAVNFTIFGESLRFNPHQQRMTFWDDLYFKYYKSPKSVVSSSSVFSVSVLTLVLSFTFVNL